MGALRDRAEQRAQAAAGPSWTRAPVPPAASLARSPAPPPAPAAPDRLALSPNLVAVAGVVAAVLLVTVIGVVVLRLAPTAEPGPIATDIVGTCFTYTADRERVGAVVPCEQDHDAKVLASVADQAACPTGTTDILTTATDSTGTAGVLCAAKAT